MSDLNIALGLPLAIKSLDLGTGRLVGTRLDNTTADFGAISDGGGGGGDATTLNGQPGSYYRNFGNLTNKPTTRAGYGITDAQPLDAGLTSLANLSTLGLYYLSANDVWSPVTIGANITFSGGTLSATGGGGGGGDMFKADNLSGLTNYSLARTNLGATTVGNAVFTATDAAAARTAIGAGTGNGTVTAVTGTAPIVSSGGTAPAISISPATTSSPGSLSAADKTKLDSNNVTGNAGTATKLLNARTINGVSFDGTANITVADPTKQPLDGDLTAIAALTGTNTIYYRSAADTWTAVAIGTGLSFSGGTLASTGGGGSTTINPSWLVKATGTGASQDITVPYSGYAVNDLRVTENGVVQNPGVNYTLSGTTLTGTFINGSVVLVWPASAAPYTQTWDFNFSAAEYSIIRVARATTIDLASGGTEGTGTVAYAKSTAAAPTTYNTTTLPATLEAGSRLKVTVSGGRLFVPLVGTA